MVNYLSATIFGVAFLKIQEKLAEEM